MEGLYVRTFPSLFARIKREFIQLLFRFLMLFFDLFDRFMIGQFVTPHGDVISHVNITHVMVEDGGEYICSAENRAGKTQHSARLNIYGLPYIRLIPKVSAIAGEILNLKCPGECAVSC